MKAFFTLIAGLVASVGSFTATAQDDVKVILDTDFTIFTDGTEAEPGDDIAASLYSGDLYDKTSKAWRGSKVHSAGGCIWIEDNGYIESQYLSGTNYSTPVKVTAVVRSGANYGGGVQLGISTTTQTVYVDDDNWTTISVVYSSGSSYSRLKVTPFLMSDGLYIKSIKIESSATFVAATTASQPTDADGTSFTAKWTSVSGATGYQLDVYSYNADGSKSYLLQGQETTTNSYAVSGLDANTTYYFVVRVVKGDYVSDNSNEVEVVKVLTYVTVPDGLNATGISDNGFTAAWNAVPEAIKYIVTLYETITLAEAGEQNVFSEDFSGVTSGSFASIEYSGNLNDYTKQSGWETDFSKAFAAGNFVIYPYGDANSVITPAIDLSANNGQFTVNLTLAEGSWGKYYSGGSVTVAALDADDNVVSSDVISIDATAYKAYSVALTGGTSATRIKLTYTDSYKLYIDDINVEQTLPAGSVVTNVVETAETEATSYVFNQVKTTDAKRTFTVQAVAQTVADGEIATIASEESAAFDVEAASGVEDVTIAATAAAWKSAADQLTVDGNATVVYDINGRIITRVNGNATIAISAKGVIIAVVDGKPFKFIF